MNNNPIGVFDSGMGGLTVRAAIAHKFPNESLIYFGDGLNVPYGGRTRDEITGFAQKAIERLLARDAKMVVVACNAATGAAIEALRTRFSNTPIVGMEPAVKPAALSTKTGVIGVLATRAAFDGELYKKTAARYRDTVKIVETVGEGFVELVENERVNSPEAFETVRKIIEPMLAENVDKIVLGCTHYPWLEEVIRRVIDEWDTSHGKATLARMETSPERLAEMLAAKTSVQIVDSAPAIARRVDNLLTENELRAAQNNVPRHEFLTFAGAEYAEKLRSMSELQKH